MPKSQGGGVGSFGHYLLSLRQSRAEDSLDPLRGDGGLQASQPGSISCIINDNGSISHALAIP